MSATTRPEAGASTYGDTLRQVDEDRVGGHALAASPDRPASATVRSADQLADDSIEFFFCLPFALSDAEQSDEPH